MYLSTHHPSIRVSILSVSIIYVSVYLCMYLPISIYQHLSLIYPCIYHSLYLSHLYPLSASVSQKWYNKLPPSSSRTFLITLKANPSSSKLSLPGVLSCFPLVTTPLPCVFINLPILDGSREWNHALCGLVSSFNLADVFKGVTISSLFLFATEQLFCQMDITYTIDSFVCCWTLGLFSLFCLCP